jgi:hypothetical protein
MPVDHPVFFKRTIVLCAIFKCKDAVAVLEILGPVTFVLGPVGVVKGSLAMTETI